MSRFLYISFNFRVFDSILFHLLHLLIIFLFCNSLRPRFDWHLRSLIHLFLLFFCDTLKNPLFILLVILILEHESFTRWKLKVKAILLCYFSLFFSLCSKLIEICFTFFDQLFDVNLFVFNLRILLFHDVWCTVKENAFVLVFG